MMMLSQTESCTSNRQLQPHQCQMPPLLSATTPHHPTTTAAINRLHCTSPSPSPSPSPPPHCHRQRNAGNPQVGEAGHRGERSSGPGTGGERRFWNVLLVVKCGEVRSWVLRSCGWKNERAVGRLGNEMVVLDYWIVNAVFLFRTLKNFKFPQFFLSGFQFHPPFF